MGPENDQDPVVTEDDLRVTGYTEDKYAVNYPPNSHKQRAEAAAPKVEKVITGKAVMRKPTLGKRIKETKFALTETPRPATTGEGMGEKDHV